MTNLSSNIPKYSLPGLKNDLLLRVINQQPVSRVPVWIMRQAGRTDPLYRKLRESDGRPLEELFIDVDQAIEISLLPQRIGVDAIIMFQDILTPLAPIGAKFHFKPGPILEFPIRSQSQVEALRPFDPSTGVRFVERIIKGLNSALQQELPLLGFAGSPMTLAFFMIIGRSPGKDYTMLFRFIEEQPKVFQQLLDVLTNMTIDYLNYQIESGVHAVQLFESFGDVVPRKIYEDYVQPTHEKIFSELNNTVPAILFVKENNFLDLMVKSGAAVLSIGSCLDMKKVMREVPSNVIIQGNIDNRLLVEGTKEQITEAIQSCFDKSQKQRHILNLNHGLLAETPFENVRHFINSAKVLGTC